ncbi:hypothetical protein C5167_044977 [Papaver somniferum]|uniref:Uncharacterized protein n=1 Tax=Papaver somniferum TaxID=3469 RepID=A0A4Y7LDB5_PAPSO|nr:hypothetical protein C5167_044977 [Papaver somniferum]
MEMETIVPSADDRVMEYATQQRAEYNCLANEIVDLSGMLYDVYGLLWRCFTRSYD